MKVYIYALKHPVTDEIRYVGLTRFPVRRLNNEIHYGHSTHFRNWINFLKKDSLKPVMEILEESEEGLACAVERKWISEMKARGCRLLNFTSGGEGGFKLEDEVRNAISLALKGKKRRPMSSETKAKISASNKGKKHPWVSKKLVEFNKSRAGIPLSDERKKQLSDIAKDRGMTEEHKQKISAASRARIGQSRFTEQQRAEIKFLIQQGYSMGAIAQAYGLSIGMVSCVKRGETWSEIEPAASASIILPTKMMRSRNEKGQYERVA